MLDLRKREAEPSARQDDAKTLAVARPIEPRGAAAVGSKEAFRFVEAQRAERNAVLLRHLSDGQRSITGAVAWRTFRVRVSGAVLIRTPLIALTIRACRSVHRLVGCDALSAMQPPLGKFTVYQPPTTTLPHVSFHRKKPSVTVTVTGAPFSWCYRTAVSSTARSAAERRRLNGFFTLFLNISPRARRHALDVSGSNGVSSNQRATLYRRLTWT